MRWARRVRNRIDGAGVRVTARAWLLESVPFPLLVATAAHLALAAGYSVAAVVEARRRARRPQATKAMRFAISIAIFLATMGFALQHLTLRATERTAFAWLFTGTMTVEMAAIGGQAIRGTRSHFNVTGTANRAVWRVMLWAIVVATVALVVVAIVATARPLREDDGSELAPLSAMAWRAGLWLLLLVPVSGFAMGSRMQHSVGGEDEQTGLPVVGWNVRHGDLRVAHFFALHAVQLLPLSAHLLAYCPISPAMRGLALGVEIASISGLCVATLVQALRGVPFFSAKALGRQDST